MPYLAPAGCQQPRCANAAVEGGRCRIHRLTTTERGYGAPWQQLRDRAVDEHIRRNGLVCPGLDGHASHRVTSRSELSGDHPDPLLLGGTARTIADIRVLCGRVNSARREGRMVHC